MAKAETDDGTPDGAPEKSIEDQAEDLEGIENALGQLPIPGTGNMLTLDAGGELPETATMKMRGGSIPVEGEFEKGTIVRLWLEGAVAEVHFVDIRDKNGFVVGTERRHILASQRIRRVEE